MLEGLKIDILKTEVLKANQALVKYGLVTMTWGNVSGIDRESNLVIIKPSGVDYEKMALDDLVIIDMDGKVVSGKWKPSTDTATHLELYRKFKGISGIAHTHSEYATVFAQACREIPCLGTTHADHFNGRIPMTRYLTKKEVSEDYELNTGRVIIERFKNLNPMDMPAVLAAGHAPFTWGKNPLDAVINSYILERVARMAFNTILIKKDFKNLPGYILKKHHSRKQGPDSYYGQK
ncbi:MAG: L-ribulose-5-phosphate 4-epimerase AraD [Candidatus Neomarinimicrobiota bacterium]